MLFRLVGGVAPGLRSRPCGHRERKQGGVAAGNLGVAARHFGMLRLRLVAGSDVAAAEFLIIWVSRFQYSYNLLRILTSM